MHKAIVLVVSCLFAAAASAQQYKWVDQDGKVRYGDTPPPGAKAQRLKPPPAPIGTPPAAAAAKKGDKPPASPEERKRQEDAQKAQQKQAEEQASAKRENCARAQESLRALESGQRVARVDSKGERYYLEDAQIAQEAVRARQMVQQNCG
jgi:Domain of unknown function (DUF4124)